MQFVDGVFHLVEKNINFCKVQYTAHVMWECFFSRYSFCDWIPRIDDSFKARFWIASICSEKYQEVDVKKVMLLNPCTLELVQHVHPLNNLSYQLSLQLKGVIFVNWLIISQQTYLFIKWTVFTHSFDDTNHTLI